MVMIWSHSRGFIVSKKHTNESGCFFRRADDDDSSIGSYLGAVTVGKLARKFNEVKRSDVNKVTSSYLLSCSNHTNISFIQICASMTNALRIPKNI